MARRRMRGMTLLELLVVATVLAITAGFAVPAMGDWLWQVKVKSGSSHFMQMLDGGRYIALAESDYVTLCPTNAESQCAASWQRSVRMFIDINGNGRQEERERSLHGDVVFPEGTWLKWQSFRRKPYIQWAPLGQTNSLNGTFTLCNSGSRPELLRQWVVSKAGRVRLVVPATSGGAVLRAALEACG